MTDTRKTGLFETARYNDLMINISTKSSPSVKIAFYLDQAAACSEAATSATLQNVRERSLRSEAAWRRMAGDIDGAVDVPVLPVPVAGVDISSSTPAFRSFA